MKQEFDEYIDLRTEIDKLSNKLFKQHKNHIKCRNGCDMCCMDYSILPIEFYYIQSQLEGKKDLNTNTDDSSCVFLKDHSCTIYEQRPIICRTHGLPLLYMNSETEEWELSACELNFTDFDEFDSENTYPQDKYNSKLFLLNEKFITNNKLNHDKFELLEIKELIKQKR